MPAILHLKYQDRICRIFTLKAKSFFLNNVTGIESDAALSSKELEEKVVVLELKLEEEKKEKEKEKKEKEESLKRLEESENERRLMRIMIEKLQELNKP